MIESILPNKNKEEYVHEIFSSIAGRYDLLNSLLSFNRDKFWRRFAVNHSGLQTGGFGLDVCCGTGMLCIEQAKVAGPGGRVVGIDFCQNMLAVAAKNIEKTPYAKNIELKYGNALNLPLPDNFFDCATIGFALRNVPDIKKTIEEMARVVRKGGKIVSVELSRPDAPLFKQLYSFYFNYMVPAIGSLAVGLKKPYAYLPESLKRFPHREKIKEIFVQAGLTGVHYYKLTGGIVTVHIGTKC